MERVCYWKKGASGKVLVVVEGDEIGLVAVGNLHGVGFSCRHCNGVLQRFPHEFVWAKCVRSVVAVRNFVSVKL